MLARPPFAFGSAQPNRILQESAPLHRTDSTIR